jgi:signal transduction histidine kinase
VSTPTGRRQFDATRSPLTNRAGERVGTAFVFQDVTDRRTREQRLEVFNRVLRHNLRNDLDAIRAFAESLADEAVDEPAAVATRIRDTASELVEVGTTVERGERVMTRDALDYRTVDLGALAADVARSVRERQDCEIEMSAGDGPRLTTDRGVLRTALAEVIENAAEHADGEAPTVRIELDATDGGARVAVRDRGPGIPERERAVLVDGEETPLRHGTGVGLWFVSWAVTRLGGTLSFEAAEPGSRVVLEIPDRGGVDPDDPL